jgi:hypothetical protein
MSDLVPLLPLHRDGTLSAAKLAQLDCFSTEILRQSLVPGQKDCLKTRPDGTILDGHHRIFLLRRRGVDVDSLPREIRGKVGV